MINKEILIKYNLIVTAQISLSTSVNIPGLEKKKGERKNSISNKQLYS